MRKLNPQVNNFMEEESPQIQPDEFYWMNKKKYEVPATHTYPKNPFSTDRNQQQLVNQ